MFVKQSPGAEDDAFILLSNWERDVPGGEPYTNAFILDALIKCAYFGRLNPSTYRSLLFVDSTLPLDHKRLRMTQAVFEELIVRKRPKNVYGEAMVAHFREVYIKVKSKITIQGEFLRAPRVNFGAPAIRYFTDPTLDDHKVRKIGFIHSSKSEEELHRSEMDRGHSQNLKIQAFLPQGLIN